MTPAERAAATERVLAHFRDCPHEWEGANCIRLAREQAVALGHDVPLVPGFRTVKGAKRALAKMGASSVPALLDQYFERWPAPAFARLGDLVVVEGEADCAGLEAICVADGQGNLFGWHDFVPERMATIKFAAAAIAAAWRV